jgi:hypothetical protein
MVEGAGPEVLAATVPAHRARVPEVRDLLQVLQTEALQVREAWDVGQSHVRLVVLVVLELVRAL